MSLSDLAKLARRFWPQTAGCRREILAMTGLVLLMPFVGAALLWLLQRLIDDLLVARALEQAPPILAAYLVVAGLKLGLDYVDERLDAAIVERIACNVRQRLFAHAAALSPGSLGARSTGDVLGHLNDDAPRIVALIYSVPLGAFSNLAASVVYLGYLFLLSWTLTVAALAVVPVLAVTVWRSGPGLRRAAHLTRRKATRWLSLAEELLSAATFLHLFAAREAEIDRFAGRLDEARAAELRVVARQARMSLLIEALVALGALLVIAIATREIAAGRLTIGSVLAFIGGLGSVYGPVRSLGRSAARLQRAAASAQRVAALLDTQSLVREAPHRPDDDRPRRPPSAAGGIEFRSVCFAYGDRTVLRDISLSIAPGETIALVGSSGSGKSTLIGLLLRLRDPTAGSVRIDGVDVRALPPGHLPKLVTAALQDPCLLNRSIAANVRAGVSGVSAADVERAARTVQAGGFITGLEHGYLTSVGARGERLSGGQRQRVALARALLRATPILVLDEATAALDSVTEEEIHEALTRLPPRRTTLLVSHRLSAVERADRVVLLDGGRIVESGAPADLRATSLRFRRLFAAQLAQARMAS